MDLCCVVLPVGGFVQSGNLLRLLFALGIDLERALRRVLPKDRIQYNGRQEEGSPGDGFPEEWKSPFLRLLPPGACWSVPRNRVRALVVDDEEMNLVVAKGILGSYEIQVDICLSGKEAVERCARLSYDMIFLDHMMPGLDGVETLRRIREIRGGIYQDLPVIALTANTISGAREMFRSEGFTEFIPKPIERVVLELLVVYHQGPDIGTGKGLIPHRLGFLKAIFLFFPVKEVDNGKGGKGLTSPCHGRLYPF